MQVRTLYVRPVSLQLQTPPTVEIGLVVANGPDVNKQAPESQGHALDRPREKCSSSGGTLNVDGLRITV